MKVIIGGGGIIGASLALAISDLSQGKVQVSLIKAMLANKTYPIFDTRSIALNYGTCQQFKQIGILSGLKKYLTPITEIYVSEYGRYSTVNIKAKDYSLPALGYVVELYDIGNYLFNQLKKTPNVNLYYPDEVISVKRTIDHVSVKLASGEVLSGELLIAADGTYSMIGETCQIEWKRESYQQCAVITNVLTSENPQGKAFELFTQYGPLAMLPISKGRSSLVWCHPLKMKQQVMHWDDNKFIEKLQRLFGWKLGKIQKVSERYCFPLLLSQARRVISHRLILVGNAAQTLHPIAGQGFNLGIRDVMVCANIISEVANYGGDLGDYSILMKYQIERKDDCQNIIKLTDNLIHLFTNNNLILTIIRNIGLMAMKRLPLIRDILARQAIGDIFYL